MFGKNNLPITSVLRGGSEVPRAWRTISYLPRQPFHTTIPVFHCEWCATMWMRGLGDEAAVTDAELCVSAVALGWKLTTSSQLCARCRKNPIAVYKLWMWNIAERADYTYRGIGTLVGGVILWLTFAVSVTVVVLLLRLVI